MQEVMGEEVNLSDLCLSDFTFNLIVVRMFSPLICRGSSSILCTHLRWIICD
jgi:hypothetical protein